MAGDQVFLPEPDPDEIGPYALIGSCRVKPGSSTALEAFRANPHRRTRTDASRFARAVSQDGGSIRSLRASRSGRASAVPGSAGRLRRIALLRVRLRSLRSTSSSVVCADPLKPSAFNKL
jgi:hypothetical protein